MALRKDDGIKELNEEMHFPLLRLKPIIVRSKKPRAVRKRKLTRTNLANFVFVEGNNVMKYEKVKDWLARNKL